jgi:hypothetical protein
MKLRRRHFVLLAVVLLIGAPLAWRYRPLNATERKLAGNWTTDDPLGSHFIFTPDRKFQNYPAAGAFSLQTGNWTAGSGKLFLKCDPSPRLPGMRGTILHLRASLTYPNQAYEFCHVSENAMSINGEKFSRNTPDLDSKQTADFTSPAAR